MVNFLETMKKFEKELDRLKKEIAQMTAQYLIEQQNQKKEPTPMPRLENGMIGLTLEHQGDMKIQDWFIVIQEAENRFRLVYQCGDYDVLYEDFPENGFNINGISDFEGDFSEIVYLTKCCNFNQAENHYEQNISVYEVWRKYDRPEN